MSHELSNNLPEEPENSVEFLEALGSLDKLNDTSIDEIFQSLDDRMIANLEIESRNIDPQDLIDDEEELEPAVNEADVWDFQKKFEGQPPRQISEEQGDAIIGSLRAACNGVFRENVQYVEPIITASDMGARLELTYPLANGDEMRTTLLRISNSDRPQDYFLQAKIQRWSEGLGREESIYAVNESTGLLHRLDRPYETPEDHRIAELTSKEDWTDDETAEIVSLFSDREAKEEVERQTGYNARPVDIAEVMKLRAIIRESIPLNFNPDA